MLIIYVILLIMQTVRTRAATQRTPPAISPAKAKPRAPRTAHPGARPRARARARARRPARAAAATSNIACARFYILVCVCALCATGVAANGRTLEFYLDILYSCNLCIPGRVPRSPTTLPSTVYDRITTYLKSNTNSDAILCAGRTLAVSQALTLCAASWP